MDQNMMRVKCVPDLIGMLKDGNIYTLESYREFILQNVPKNIIGNMPC